MGKSWKELGVSGLTSAVAVSALLLGAPAKADVISSYDTWYEFGFGDTGSAWDTSFTFTLASPTTLKLKVTDGYEAGDRFSVAYDSNPLGDTSVPTGTLGDNAGGNYDAAFADAKWSSGSWTLALGAGTHTIAGKSLVSALKAGGSGAVQLTAVPEPGATALLASLGVLGFAAVRKYRRGRQTDGR